jgi:peptidoglycan/xylan/chitin deacetylase (PgdA/CDA1 family)
MKGLHILFYHLVSNTKKDHYPLQNTVSIKLFNEQVKYFSQKYEIININEAYNRFLSGAKFDKQLVITTDDGFVENYKTICPILESYNVKGSFFLIENSIDNIQMMWRHALFVLESKIQNLQLQSAISSLAQKFNIPQPKKKEGLLNWSYRAFPYKLKEQLTTELWNEVMPFSLSEYLNNIKPYLSSAQIKEILRNGHVIGNHTRSHPNCSLLNEEELKFEIHDSVKSLGNNFNTNVLAFSFPFERSYRATEILKNGFSDVKVLLGTLMKRKSNSNSPYYWERMNMETKKFKSRILLEPLKNELLHH